MSTLVKTRIVSLSCALALWIPVAGTESIAQTPAELTVGETGLLATVGRWAEAAGIEWTRAELDPEGQLTVSGIHVPLGRVEVEIAELLMTGSPGHVRAVPSGLVDIRLDGERLTVPAFASAELVLRGEPASGTAVLRFAGLEAEVAPEAPIMQPQPLADNSDRQVVRWAMSAGAEDLEVSWAAGQGVRFTVGGGSLTMKTGLAGPAGESLTLQTDTTTISAIAGRVLSTAGTFRFEVRYRNIVSSNRDATGAGYDLKGESGMLAWATSKDAAGVLLSGAHRSELANATLEVTVPDFGAMSFGIAHLREELQALAGAGDTLSVTITGIRSADLGWADGFPELERLLADPASVELEVALLYEAGASGPTLAAMLFGGEIAEWILGEPSREWVDQFMEQVADPEMVRLTRLEAGVGGIRVQADGHWIIDPESVSRLGLRVDGLRSFLAGLPADTGGVTAGDVLDALARRLGTLPDALELEIAGSGERWTINGDPLDYWLEVLLRAQQIAAGDETP